MLGQANRIMSGEEGDAEYRRGAADHEGKIGARLTKVGETMPTKISHSVVSGRSPLSKACLDAVSKEVPGCLAEAATDRVAKPPLNSFANLILEADRAASEFKKVLAAIVATADCGQVEIGACKLPSRMVSKLLAKNVGNDIHGDELFNTVFDASAIRDVSRSLIKVKDASEGIAVRQAVNFLQRAI